MKSISLTSKYGAIVRHVWKFPLRLISIMNISHFKEKMNTFIKILGKMC